MGANLSYLKFPASKARPEILKQWNDAVEQSLYDSGHSYSGEIGMLGVGVATWYDLNLDENAAVKFLRDNHKKWTQGIAVSFIEGGEKFWLIGGWCAC